MTTLSKRYATGFLASIKGLGSAVPMLVLAWVKNNIVTWAGNRNPDATAAVEAFIDFFIENSEPEWLRTVPDDQMKATLDSMMWFLTQRGDQERIERLLNTAARIGQQQEGKT